MRHPVRLWLLLTAAAPGCAAHGGHDSDHPAGGAPADGFYVLLPGDDQLIVGRDRERNVVGGLHLQGNVSQPKVYRTHRDPGRSFGLPVPDRAGRGTEGR